MGKYTRQFTNEQVEEIAQRVHAGDSCRSIAIDCGVQPSTISRLVKQPDVVARIAAYAEAAKAIEVERDVAVREKRRRESSARSSKAHRDREANKALGIHPTGDPHRNDEVRRTRGGSDGRLLGVATVASPSDPRYSGEWIGFTGDTHGSREEQYLREREEARTNAAQRRGRHIEVNYTGKDGITGTFGLDLHDTSTEGKTEIRHRRSYLARETGLPDNTITELLYATPPGASVHISWEQPEPADEYAEV